MTDPVVTQADRVAAWPFADFHCLPESQMHERWLSGWYDKLDAGAAIQAFARHRLEGERAGMEKAARIAEDCAANEGLFSDYFQGRDQGCHDAAAAIRNTGDTK